MSSTYSHTAVCPNCSHRNAYAIPKGTTIECFLSGQDCENCGCDMVRISPAPAPRYETEYGTGLLDCVRPFPLESSDNILPHGPEKR